jgi:Flp pilus assembly protein TadD
VLKDQGEFAEAETHLREVVERRTAYFGEEHEHTLIALNNLADVLASRGQYGESEALQRRALAIKERVLGPDDRSTLISRHNLGLTLLLSGRYEDALPFFRECAERAPRAYPAGHWSIASFRESHGACLQHLQRFDEAQVELLAALEAMRGSFDDDNPRVQTIQARLHDLYVAWHKPDEAAKYPTGQQ